VSAGDSVSSLADVWGVDAFELLYNNSANIEDVSKPLEGTVLSVCDICEWLASGGGVGWGGGWGRGGGLDH
jgi:hypothetical protein